jgi:hypothetical protein
METSFVLVFTTKKQKQKKLKKYKSDIKESGIRLFFGPRGISYAPFATSGE